jgi:hypothetical protein
MVAQPFSLRADRQHEKAGNASNLLNDVAVAATGEDAREPGLVLQLEDLMETRSAHVGVHQQRAATQLGKRHRQVGGAVGLAIARVGADDGECSRGRSVVEQAHHELTAKCAKPLGPRRKRLVERNQFGADVALLLGRIGVMKLLRQREEHVVLAGIAQRDRRFPEAHTRLTLVLEHLFHLLGRQIAQLGNDVANAAFMVVYRGVGVACLLRVRRVRPCRCLDDGHCLRCRISKLGHHAPFAGCGSAAISRCCMAGTCL